MHDMLLTPDALTWRDHPNIPKGGQVTILVGDPTKTGEVVVQRLKLPPNYHVPPHIHSFTEYGTVISGSFGAGAREKFERTGELLKPSSFWIRSHVKRDGLLEAEEAVRRRLVVGARNHLQANRLVRFRFEIRI